MSDKVKLTSMAIREMLMDYYKGGSGMCFAKNGYLNWNPVSSPGHQYNYQQTRRNILDERGLIFGTTCLLVVSKNPDTAKFCVDSFKDNAIMQEIQRGMEEVFQKYLKGVKVNYDGKGGSISQRNAKDWCEKSRYIDQFEAVENPYASLVADFTLFYDQSIPRRMSFTDIWATTSTAYGAEVDSDE